MKKDTERATVEAPSNIAFVKYWGAKNLERVVPYNPSISMTLEEAVTRTTAVFHRGEDGEDVVSVRQGNDVVDPGSGFTERVTNHITRLREVFGVRGWFEIETRNTFPSAAGVASSASGFAALTLAVASATGQTLDRVQFSRLARASGSGSASRSVMGGYVQWPGDGQDDDATYAVQLFDGDYWSLCDLIAIVDTDPKDVSSRDGHLRAASSPYFKERLRSLPARQATVRQAIADRAIENLGPVVEKEAIDMHLIAMSSAPPIFYWSPATLAVLAALRDLRASGLEAWATMDAGANVHVICEPSEADRIQEELRGVQGVLRVLRDRTGKGPRVLESSAPEEPDTEELG